MPPKDLEDLITLDASYDDHDLHFERADENMRYAENLPQPGSSNQSIGSGLNDKDDEAMGYANDMGESTRANTSAGSAEDEQREAEAMDDYKYIDRTKT